VSQKAYLDVTDVNGDNALHWAVYRGFPDLSRLLVIYGINPKKIDNYDQTALHLACLNGNLNIVQHLIEEVIKLINNLNC
jgi:palmitoyltransferase ZDHHC13/17